MSGVASVLTSQPLVGRENTSTDDREESVVYEPLETVQNKENSVNHCHYNSGPLSTRHGYGSDHSRGGRQQRLVDGMVKVANACNLLVRKNCNLCHVYADRQVEFEQREETDKDGGATSSRTTSAFAGMAFSSGMETTSATTASTSPAERAWRKLNSNIETEIYRQFLFDEDSVVDMYAAEEETTPAETPQGSTCNQSPQSEPEESKPLF